MTLTELRQIPDDTHEVEMAGGEFVLSREGRLWSVRSRDGLKLKIDFDAAGADYHRPQPKGRQELIARAMGSKHGVRKILDLSAGLGQDAVSLCQLGFSVTAVERNPLLAFLLQEAQRWTTRPELKELKVEHAEALDFLSQQKLLSSFEAIYFDPMYPMKTKSALPRQEMRLFRLLVGEDPDAASVALRARSQFLGRIVIKRPLSAPPLLENPQHSFEGKTVRYDTYTGGL